MQCNGPWVPGHQRDTVGVVEFVARYVEVGLAPAQLRPEAVEAEVGTGDAFGNGVREVLQPPTVRRQDGDLGPVPGEQRAIKVGALPVPGEKLGIRGVRVAQAVVVGSDGKGLQIEIPARRMEKHGCGKAQGVDPVQ